MIQLHKFVLICGTTDQTFTQYINLTREPSQRSTFERNFSSIFCSIYVTIIFLSILVT